MITLNVVSVYPDDARRQFAEHGTCSHTLCFILDREFGHLKPAEEQAAALFVGGLLRGEQCGLVWGGVLAVGAEALRRYPNRDQAMALAIMASSRLIEAFTALARAPNCHEITGCNWQSVPTIAKYFLTGKKSTCFTLAADWAPVAIRTAREALASEPPRVARAPLSCASETVRRMGAGDEEALMVAGFAGGLGLSGHACGALAAALWMRQLERCREGRARFFSPESRRIMRAFEAVAGSDLSCQRVCGRRFETIDEHTAFVQAGGCAQLIAALAAA